MSQHTNPIHRTVTFFALAVGLISISAAMPPIQSVRLADSVPDGVQEAVVIGSPAASQLLPLAVGLKPSNPAALQALADAVSDPRSPDYRHFVTPDQIGAEFGAGLADVDNVVTFLKAKGFTITLVARNRMVILATATVAQAQYAFGTQIKTFRGPDSNGNIFTYQANSTPLMVPSNIAGVIQCVAGLDTYARSIPRTTLNPTLARGLYNTAPSYAAGVTGVGCKIGVSNWDGFKLSNAQLYIAAYGLPVPSGGSTSNVHVVSVFGSNNNTTGGAEGDLDIQMELSAAPLADIYVYDSTSGNLLLTLTKEQNDNIVDIISESYGWSGMSAAVLTSAHGEHLSMTAQGQTYLAASGDSGTSELGSYYYPDIDSEVTNVGGTVATVNTTTGVRSSEVGWSGSGGGWSTGSFGTINFNLQPSWQTGTGVPNKGFRLVPDIALQSSGGSGGAFRFYYNGAATSGYDGTSFASPWTAGCLATLEQRLAANGQTRRFGRINDLIYFENGRSDIWFDITSGSNGQLPDGTTSNAGPGWDFVTGWGAPNFDGWYNVLAIQTVVPSSYSVFRGVLFSGNLASLASIDQNYLRVISGPTLNTTEAPVQVIVNGTAQLASASKLEVDVTAHSSTNIAQAIDVYNWTTGAYVTVDTRAASTSDSTVKISIPNPNQFIQSGTEAVRARIRYYQTGPTLTFPWSVDVDQVVWKATPA